MNICLLTSTFFPFVGGREIVVHNLARALVDVGHQVSVVAPYYKKDHRPDKCNYSLIRPNFRGCSRMKLISLMVVLSLFRLIVRNQMDVLNVHSVYLPGIWAFYFKIIFKKVPIIGTPHGDDIQITPEIGDGVRLDPQKDQIVRRNVNSFTRVTAISPSIREDLRKLVRNENHIADVPNGVWVSEFRKDIDEVAVKEKYGIPADCIILISIGRNHPRKGFLYAIDTLEKLRKDGFNAAYILVGRDMSSLVQRAGERGIADYLFTPGEVSTEEVSELLQVSDIFVSPAIVESFGLTTLEAMSAGLPCVVTNVSGSKDLVSQEYGFLVKPGNSEELANAIKRLIDNPSMRESMGMRAGIQAEKYDWHEVAKMYLRVYKEAIDFQR